MSKILAFSGSARKGSLNTKLLGVVAAAAREAGAEVTRISLADYALPIFDEDLESEQGLPDNAKKLKELFKSHQGLLFACPEYNSSFTPLWKNTIDWVTRPAEGEKPLECFRGKTAALVSASPGYYGGYRGLQQVRYVLGNIGVLVMPDMFALAKAHEAFDDDGRLKDQNQSKMAGQIGENLASALRA